MEKQPLLQKPEDSSTWSLKGWITSCLPRAPPMPENPPDDLEAMLHSSSPSDSDPLPELPSAGTVRSKLGAGEKLKELRKLMKRHNIAVYIVPSEDEHQSEFTAVADKRREFLTGFKGSAGIAVVTLDDAETLSGEAALSTDGRYFLQAEKELDLKYWQLLKQGQVGYPSWQEFALKRAASSNFSNIISVDPKLLSLSVGQYFSSTSRYRGVVFKPFIEYNLVDEVWGNEKPSRTRDKAYVYTAQYSGESTNDKIARVRNIIRQKGATHLVITALDDIGWLFNLRADHSIPFSPFFFAYAVVSLEKVWLYADNDIIASVKPYLLSIESLSIKPYESFYLDLSTIKATVHDHSVRVILPSKSACNYALLTSLPSSVSRQTLIYNSVVAELKLVKNKTELLNAKVAQAKDSLVSIIFFAWLENELIHKKNKINEYEAAQKIYSIRARFPSFKGLSYETISSTGPNAAIIHYEPTKDNNAIIDPKLPYLIDSGGHYLEGTTDITRTFKFGPDGLTHEMMKYFTLVLKGHIAVAMAKFPAESPASGTILDAYARQALWNEGLDFNHGTGHGVGAFGNVHEGPLYISTTAGGSGNAVYFKEGGILTNEPGYYVDGKFGFRVESELEIIKSKVGKSRQGEEFLAFNYLTKVPLGLNLIDPQYLSSVEKRWINSYHQSIVDDFGNMLLKIGEYRAYAWLLKETTPIA
ncbi:hypothetical protein FDK38_004708 [Candidozyma auris]|nr:hypothetical protein FDK38_004708 [[Candida] auris]